MSWLTTKMILVGFYCWCWGVSDIKTSTHIPFINYKGGKFDIKGSVRKVEYQGLKQAQVLEWSRLVNVKSKSRVRKFNSVTVNASSGLVQFKVLNVKNKTGKYPGMGSVPTKKRGQEGMISGQTYELGSN